MSVKSQTIPGQPRKSVIRAQGQRQACGGQIVSLQAKPVPPSTLPAVTDRNPGIAVTGWSSSTFLRRRQGAVPEFRGRGAFSPDAFSFRVNNAIGKHEPEIKAAQGLVCAQFCPPSSMFNNKIATTAIPVDERAQV